MHNQDALIKETLRFTRHHLDMSGAIFYWVNTVRQEMDVHETLDLPSGFLEDYALNMRSLDPMRVSRMLENHERVGVLSCELSNHPRMEMVSYLGHLGSFGFKDTIDLMFWNEGVAFGGVSLLKVSQGADSHPCVEKLYSMQRFIETSFENHPRVREIRYQSYLTKRGLSHREKMVVGLICDGFSNKDIAYSMSISLPTVKTYVNRIFDKLSIDSRTELVAQILK